MQCLALSVVCSKVASQRKPCSFNHLFIITGWPQKPTNLENLEHSGISLNVENSGNSQGILSNLSEKL